MHPDNGTPRARWPWAALVLLYGIGVAARFATAQLIANPLVSSDELVYRNMALSFFQTGSFYENTSLGKVAGLPNVLYALLIAPSFFFGDDFFAVARLINSLLIHLSLFAVYAMAREFMDQRRSLVAAAVTALAPALNAPMFLMTESLVYPVFLFAFFLAFKALTSPATGWRVAAGAGLAISMLAKPGFVLLLVGLLLVHAGILARALAARDWTRTRDVLTSLAVVVVSGLTVFTALSFALKGRLDYGLGTYSFFTTNRTDTDPVPYTDLALNACAHAGTFLFTWFIPVFVCARVAAARESDPRLRLFLALTFTALLVYLCGVLKLTNAMAFQEHFLRLHGRYYTMFFPLFVVGFLAGYASAPWNGRTRAAAIALCVAVTAANIAYVFPRYAASGLLIVDYPDLTWHLEWPGWKLPGSAATLSVLGLYAWRKRITAGPALVCVAFLSLIANLGEVRQAMHYDRINSAQVDPVKNMVHTRLPDLATRLAIVDSINLYRFTIAFWYPYHYTASLLVPSGGFIERARIPSDTEYIVACDNYPFDFPVAEVAREGSKAIYAVTRE